MLFSPWVLSHVGIWHAYIPLRNAPSPLFLTITPQDAPWLLTSHFISVYSLSPILYKYFSFYSIFWNIKAWKLQPLVGVHRLSLLSPMLSVGQRRHSHHHLPAWLLLPASSSPPGRRQKPQQHSVPRSLPLNCKIPPAQESVEGALKLWHNLAQPEDLV